MLKTIVDMSLKRQVGLVLDKYDGSWYYIPPEEVSSVSLEDGATILWAQGAMDITEISAVRCGGKVGDTFKTLFGEEKGDKIEKALASLVNKKKN